MKRALVCIFLSSSCGTDSEADGNGTAQQPAFEEIEVPWNKPAPEPEPEVEEYFEVDPPEPQEFTNGLSVEWSKGGRGPQARRGDRISVHYRGFFTESGEEFESSYKSGIPFTFTLGEGEVIQAWDLALDGSRLGTACRLDVPAPLAYGEQGLGRVPPDTDLLFEIEVVKIH